MTTLTPAQSQAIARLLAGMSVAAVARELGIDRSTIYEWRNTKPQFRRALDDGRAVLGELTADALADLAATAVDTLRHLLTSVITPPSVRLRAAELVLRLVGQPRNGSGSAPSLPSDAEPSAAAAPSPCPGPSAPASVSTPKPGRNEPCPCGSLKKYKRCCGNPLAPSGGLSPTTPGPQNPTQSDTSSDTAGDPPPLDRAA